MIERQLPYWYVHTWDRTRDAQRSFRLDRMRSARMQRETFEPREGFRPDHLGSAGVVARIWYSKKIARWKAEEGARPLSDGAALADKAVGSEEWLVGDRELERDGRAFAVARAHLERAAVSFRDRPRDEQAEPGARLRLLPGYTPELLEDQRVVLGRDSRAAVADLDADAAVFRERLDLDLAAGR